MKKIKIKIYDDAYEDDYADDETIQVEDFEKVVKNVEKIIDQGITMTDKFIELADRIFPKEDKEDSNGYNKAKYERLKMTVHEAAEALGIPESASKEEIIRAFKRKLNKLNLQPNSPPMTKHLYMKYHVALAILKKHKESGKNDTSAPHFEVVDD